MIWVIGLLISLDLAHACKLGLGGLEFLEEIFCTIGCLPYLLRDELGKATDSLGEEDGVADSEQDGRECAHDVIIPCHGVWDTETVYECSRHVIGCEDGHDHCKNECPYEFRIADLVGLPIKSICCIVLRITPDIDSETGDDTDKSNNIEYAHPVEFGYGAEHIYLHSWQDGGPYAHAMYSLVTDDGMSKSNRIPPGPIYVPLRLAILCKHPVDLLIFLETISFLYPHLNDICKLLKNMGFKVSIVSNGSRITEQRLEEIHPYLDWLGLSIDSPDGKDEVVIGRCSDGCNHLDNVKKVSEMAHKLGIKVKLNITAVRKSINKDFGSLIAAIAPERVKVFRALTLKGANDDVPDTWSVSDKEFESFKERHSELPNTVFEDNSDMIGSYLMFDPIGRWMVNKGEEKRFLPFEQLVRNGMESELEISRYYGRNAIYDW